MASLESTVQEVTRDGDVQTLDVSPTVTAVTGTQEDGRDNQRQSLDAAETIAAAAAEASRFCNHPTVTSHRAQRLHFSSQSQGQGNDQDGVQEDEHEEEQDQVFSRQAPRHPRFTVDEIYLGRSAFGGSNHCCRWDYGIPHTCGKPNLHAGVPFGEDGWRVRVKERRLSAASKNSNRRLCGRVEEMWPKEEKVKVKKPKKEKKTAVKPKTMAKQGVSVKGSGEKGMSVVDLGKEIGRRVSRLWSKDSGYASLPSGVTSTAESLRPSEVEIAVLEDDACFGAPLSRMTPIMEWLVDPKLEHIILFTDPWRNKSVSNDGETKTRSAISRSRCSSVVEDWQTAPQGISRAVSSRNGDANDNLHLDRDFRDQVVLYIHTRFREIAHKGEFGYSTQQSRWRLQSVNHTSRPKHNAAPSAFEQTVEHRKSDNPIGLSLLQQAEGETSDPDVILRGRKIDRYDASVPWGPGSASPSLCVSAAATREPSPTWSDMVREPLDCLVF